jgi:hypothetical protein
MRKLKAKTYLIRSRNKVHDKYWEVILNSTCDACPERHKLTELKRLS